MRRREGRERVGVWQEGRKGGEEILGFEEGVLRPEIAKREAEGVDLRLARRVWRGWGQFGSEDKEEKGRD